MEIKVYLIRHKATGQFMPQMRAKGYSHWNPGDPRKTDKKPVNQKRVIRVLAEERDAKIAITMWATMPNGRMKGYTTVDGENDYDLFTRDDDRTKDDLEIVPAKLLIDDPT